MRSLEEDMFTEDIYEEANFTDAQFEEMLEWIKKRRFYLIGILIEAKDIETDKDVIIEGSVLKSFEYSLYPRTMVVLVENVIMAEEKVDIPYFIVIEKSRFELYRNRISRKPRKGTITKNIQLVVEGIQEIRGFLEETGKESRKVKEKLLIKNYKLRNDFKNDTGNEVVILKRDYSKKFSHISNLARTHDVKAILEGTYYFFDKQVDAVVKGTIMHLDESPEKLQLKLITILQKDRDIIKLFLEKGDFIEILDEIKQKGFYPDILFLQMNKEKKRHKNVIKVKNLTISFGKRTIIDKASFDIQRGSIVGIIGESGAGKSTTVKAILGELKYQGKITIMGIDAKKTKQIAPFMGYVPQDLSLMYHDFSPMENMIHFGRQYGLDEKVIARKAKDLLEDLQIPEYISKPLGSLSGGQKRRVSVAIAMIHDPDILILDEPTSGLDPMTRFELWKFFDKINKMYGITLIVISHYLDEIEYSDKSAVYLRGVGILDYDTPKNLKKSLPGNGKSLEITLEKIDLRALNLIDEIEEVDEIVQRGERIRVLSDQYSPELKKEIIHTLESNDIEIFETEENVIVDMVDYFTIKSRHLGSGRLIRDNASEESAPNGQNSKATSLKEGE